MVAAASERWVPDPATRAWLGSIGVRLDAPASTADLLRRPEVDGTRLAPGSPVLRALSPDDLRIVTETLRYTGYLVRQQREAERVARAGAHPIPDAFTYRGLPGLSHELVEKLERVRPDTLGRASRIDGMTPAALAANRDEVFFRAGEASARSEQRESPKAHRIVWPAVAAALALLAAGLGAAIAMREPAVRARSRSANFWLCPQMAMS